MHVRPYADRDRERWDAFVDATPGSHPGQRIAWRQLTEATYGCRSQYLLAEEAGNIRGILPLFEKGRLGRVQCLFSSPGGMLAADDSVAAALLAPVRERVAQERLAYAELRDQSRAWPDLATSEEHCSHRLELAAEVDQQWAAFDAKLRNQIRKAQKAKLDFRRGHHLVGAFHRVMLENMRDLGTPMRSEAYFGQALDLFAERADILLVEYAGEPIGAMFVAFHRDCVFDLWASSLRRHFSRCPNQMLYWEALRIAIERGMRSFDFGRSQWDSNTFRFKEQWGAKAVPLAYQYLLGTAPGVPRLAEQRRAFDLATNLWRRLPLPLARLLGEPVRKLFPELM